MSIKIDNNMIMLVILLMILVVFSVVVTGLTYGIIGGLFYGLFVVLKQEVKMRLRANQGIWNSFQSMILITAFSYPLGVIVLLLLTEGLVKNLHWMTVFPQSLERGLFIALLIGLGAGGGQACVQHLCLRFILWKSGTIPWNFARFLNYCVERRLLLRVGGRYRFLHRELLDHFAQSGS
jgi:hypothetical protein